MRITLYTDQLLLIYAEVGRNLLQAGEGGGGRVAQHVLKEVLFAAPVSGQTPRACSKIS